VAAAGDKHRPVRGFVRNVDFYSDRDFYCLGVDVKVSDKYLLNLLRQVVSARASGHCEFPGCSNTECDPHHWRSKKNLVIRYDPDACLYLCTWHHTGNTMSAHLNPEGFEIAIIKSGVRTQVWADAVEQKKNLIITGFKKPFMETCKWQLEDELRRIAA